MAAAGSTRIIGAGKGRTEAGAAAAGGASAPAPLAGELLAAPPLRPPLPVDGLPIFCLLKDVRKHARGAWDFLDVRRAQCTARGAPALCRRRAEPSETPRLFCPPRAAAAEAMGGSGSAELMSAMFTRGAACYRQGKAQGREERSLMAHTVWGGRNNALALP